MATDQLGNREVLRGGKGHSARPQPNLRRRDRFFLHFGYLLHGRAIIMPVIKGA
jgi:hypothetical protein